MGNPTVHVVTTDVEGVKAASSNVTPPEAKTEWIRRDIEQTRAEMSETIDAIQRKLDPEVLKEKAKERFVEAKDHVKEEVREATVGKVQHMVQRAGRDVREARTTVMDTIRENPIPAAMVAGGLAWLIMGGRKQVQERRGGGYDNRRAYATPRYIEDDYDVYGDYEFGAVGSGYEGAREGRVDRVKGRVQDVAGAASAKAHEVTDKVTDKASELAHRTRDEASDLADRARREARDLRFRAGSEARRMERTFERTYRENPIGIGLAALAIGSIVGAALPRTRREDELLGRTRDKLMSRARDVAGEAVEKVKETADEKLTTMRASQA